MVKNNLRRSSSVGQSARLIFVMSGVQIPPPLPTYSINLQSVIKTPNLSYHFFQDEIEHL